MLGSLWRLVLYRFLGGRIMLALALLGLARRLLGGRREPAETYQPSQGSSQIVHREPR